MHWKLGHTFTKIAAIHTLVVTAVILSAEFVIISLSSA